MSNSILFMAVLVHVNGAQAEVSVAANCMNRPNQLTLVKDPTTGAVSLSVGIGQSLQMVATRLTVLRQERVMIGIVNASSGYQDRGFRIGNRITLKVATSGADRIDLIVHGPGETGVLARPVLVWSDLRCEKNTLL